MATTDFHLGTFASARRHHDQAIGLYEAHELSASFAYRYGIELGAIAYAYAAWRQCLLGYPEQALRLNQRALTVANQAKHALTTARVLYCSTVVYQCRGDWSVVDVQAEQLIALASEQDYAMGVAAGRILRGAACAALGDRECGTREVRDGMAAYQATGARFHRPHHLALLAGALHARGFVEEGLTILSEAASLVAETEERYYEAEIHRLKGALLLAGRGVGAEGIATSYRTAMEVARDQQARLLELRAARDLARLWAEQGERQRARDLLSPIYEIFTEGIDTPDLLEVKSLLDALG